MNPILSLPAFVASLPSEFTAPVSSAVGTLADYVMIAAASGLVVFVSLRAIQLIHYGLMVMTADPAEMQRELDDFNAGEIRAEWAAIGYDGNAFNPDGSEASHEDNAWRKMEWNSQAGPDEQLVLNDAEVDALYSNSDPTSKPFDPSGYVHEFDDEGNAFWRPEGGQGITDDSADGSDSESDEFKAWERGEYN